MNRIREYRIEKNIKLSELAYKCNISTGYLCHLEKGTRKNPTYSVMINIANVLGKDLKDIF